MFEKIVSKINQYDSIVIFGHLNPDGDCYGSQVALKAILQKKFIDKKILICGSGLPIFYQLLGKMDDVSDDDIKNSLAIILDCNDLNRVEDKRVFTAKDFAKIDHHINLFTFTEGPEVIDASSTSTSELIYLLASENQWIIPKVAAEALYLGMFTDTSRFQYSTNYVQMFDILKGLINLGVEPTKLTAILNSTTFFALKLKSFIFRHYKRDKAGILYVYATKEERDRLGATSTQIVANTNLLSNVKKYPVWFIACENDFGGIQVEMRTNLINVQEIAASFGGGGHKYAAGFTTKEYRENILDELLDKIREALKGEQ